MTNKDQEINIDNFDVEAEIAFFATKGRALGHTLLIRLFEDDDRTSGGIIIPDSVKAEGQFRHCVGLVVQKGPEAYKTNNGEPRKFADWVEVGQWVVFPRNAAQATRYQLAGRPVFSINDDQPLLEAFDPRDIKRT